MDHCFRKLADKARFWEDAFVMAKMLGGALAIFAPIFAYFWWRENRDDIMRKHNLKQAKKILGRDKARFEEALYNHDLSIKSDDEYKLRKKIVWDKFIRIAQEVFEKEKE